MADGSPSVLLLIPAYNEEERIGPVLRDYATYFREHYEGEFRAVVVLNGCRDNTLGVVEEVAEEFPEIEPLNFEAPIGKGGALIEGFKKATEAEAVLTGYVDADGATPAKAFRRTHQALRRRRGGLRDRFTLAAWLCTAPKPNEIAPCIQSWLSHNCGAALLARHRRHAMSRQARAARGTGGDSGEPRIADLAFDVNLLVSLKQRGYTIKEVPIEWTTSSAPRLRPTFGACRW